MMSKRQDLLERVATLPDELLNEVEQSLDDIVSWHQSGMFRLSDDERVAVRKGVEAADRGDFVSDDDVAAFRKRLGG